jgi:hypothetical protein
LRLSSVLLLRLYAVSRVSLKKEKREEMSSLPLNANETRVQLINVDSRFRDNIIEPPTDFMYSYSHSIRNIIQMRVASVEIPMGYYTFSRSRKNTMFRVDSHDYTGAVQTMTVTIPDGDYTPACLIQHIQEEFNRIRDTIGIFFRISLNPINRRVTISHDGSAPPPCPAGPVMKATAFGLTFSMIGLENRSYQWGLGSYLGFTKPFVEATTPEITGESLIDTAGDSYFLVAVDDFHAVDHHMKDGYLQCMAKVLLKKHHVAPGAMGNIVSNDGYTVISNEVVHTRPIDLARSRIRLMDAYGIPIDLHHLNWSLTLEVTLIMNPERYDRHRLANWPVPEPRVGREATGSGVSIALPGRSFN